jgi:hypothetical protein
MFGIVANSANCSQSALYTVTGYYLHFYDGSLYSIEAKAVRPYTRKIVEGSEVKMVINSDEGTISFVIDGVDKGIAYEQIPKDTFVPVCNIYQSLVTVTILE